MKTLSTLTFITVIFFINCVTVQGQNISITTYSEITRISPKVGIQLGTTLPLYCGKIEVGGFYQKSLVSQSGEAQLKKFEHEFYGMYASFFLIDKNKVDLKFNIRSGSVNGKYFCITPAIKSQIRLSNALSFEGGFGLRNMRPTLITGLTILL